jgi:hypothetical protein
MDEKKKKCAKNNIDFDGAFQELLDLIHTEYFTTESTHCVAPTIHLANRCDEFILDRI